MRPAHKAKLVKSVKEQTGMSVVPICVDRHNQAAIKCDAICTNRKRRVNRILAFLFCSRSSSIKSVACNDKTERERDMRPMSPQSNDSCQPKKRTYWNGSAVGPSANSELQNHRFYLCAWHQTACRHNIDTATYETLKCRGKHNLYRSLIPFQFISVSVEYAPPPLPPIRAFHKVFGSILANCIFKCNF